MFWINACFEVKGCLGTLSRNNSNTNFIINLHVSTWKLNLYSYIYIYICIYIYIYENKCFHVEKGFRDIRFYKKRNTNVIINFTFSIGILTCVTACPAWLASRACPVCTACLACQGFSTHAHKLLSNASDHFVQADYKTGGGLRGAGCNNNPCKTLSHNIWSLRCRILRGCLDC